MAEAKKTTRELYGGDVRITFYPDSHRYRMEGERSCLISTTAATGIIDKSRPLIFWAIGLANEFLVDYVAGSPSGRFTAEELLPVIDEAMKRHSVVKEKAASNGSMVHDWAERFAAAKIAGEDIPPVPEKCPEEVANGIIAFLDWFNGHDIEFLEAERLVYSRKHGYVGITDAVAIVDGHRYILDYKTSKGVYDEYHFQLAAYRAAYEEEMGGELEGALIVHFGKDTGEFHVVRSPEEDREKNIGAFLACLAIKKRLGEMAKY